MTIKEMLNVSPNLSLLIKTPGIDAVTGYQLAKVAQQIREKLTIFKEIQDTKVMELGEPEVIDGVQTGNYRTKTDAESQKQWAEIYKSLVSQEEEIKYSEIKLSAFKDIKVAPEIFVGLTGWLIVE